MHVEQPTGSATDKNTGDVHAMTRQGQMNKFFGLLGVSVAKHPKKIIGCFTILSVVGFIKTATTKYEMKSFEYFRLISGKRVTCWHMHLLQPVLDTNMLFTKSSLDIMDKG